MKNEIFIFKSGYNIYYSTSLFLLTTQAGIIISEG